MSVSTGRAVDKALKPEEPTIAVFGGSVLAGSEGSAGYDCVVAAPPNAVTPSVPSLIECALPLRAGLSASDCQRVPGSGQLPPLYRTNLPASSSSRSPSDIHSFTR